MVHHLLLPALATLLVPSSSAYPLAALSALLGGHGFSANLNSNLNNFDDGLNRQQLHTLQQHQQPQNTCPCSQPQAEIFVTETPRGSEIVAAETTNGNEVSVATINEDHGKLGLETRSQDSTVEQNSLWPTSESRSSGSSVATGQPIPIYPNRSYAGSVSGALSGVGNLGHAVSASGSVAGNLGYSGSMSGAGGTGNGLGHVGSMAGSLVGPHGSLAGSLSGSHGIQGGGSMAGSMAGSHQGGSMAGSLARSDNSGFRNMAGNDENASKVDAAGGAASSERNSYGGIPVAVENVNDPRQNEERNQRTAERMESVTDGSNSVGTFSGGVTGRESDGASAGSVADATNQNGGSVAAGSLASTSGNGRVHAGSVAGAGSIGSQNFGGDRVISGSLAGSHNGIVHAISSAISGYHRQNENALPQPQAEGRKSFSGNKNMNRNVNINSNTFG